MEPISLDALRERHAADDDLYLEFLREPSMSLGLYRIPAGDPDPQTPHDEDEVYLITSGRASIRIDDETYPVAEGDVIFVEAGVEHEFFGIEADLETLVVFAPPEGSSSGE